VVNGVPGEPGPLWPPHPAPQLLVPNGDLWILAKQGLQGARSALQELQAKPAVANEVRIEELQSELRSAEQALRRDEYVLDEYLNEFEQQREALGNVDRRLAAIEQDLRRNKDTKRLRQFGSILPLHVTQGECPTCQQPLQDSLLTQALEAAPMSLDDNIAFIESQKATFQSMRQNTLRLVAAKEARFEAHQARVEQERTDIRMLRQTLMGERAPVEREIRQRLQFEEWIQKAESALAEFDQRLQQFSELATQWANVQAALKGLPEGDISAADVNKLSALEKSMRQQLREYRFESLSPDSLSISHDTFRPEHEKFEFEVTTSASDLIRMIWAYVNGLMEVARSQGQT
jgi:DNA repair exonuclease SbcCD ATPase subunit